MFKLANITIVLLVLLVVTGFMPTITELPFGIDDVMILFVNSVKGMLVVMPWMQVVWNLFLTALFIKFLLISWHWIKWFVELIAG